VNRRVSGIVVLAGFAALVAATVALRDVVVRDLLSRGVGPGSTGVALPGATDLPPLPEFPYESMEPLVQAQFADAVERVRLADRAAAASDHHGQFQFPIDRIRRDRRNRHRFVRIGKRGRRRFHENVGKRLGPFCRHAAALFDMLGVVASKQKQFRWPGIGHQQFDLIDRHPQRLGFVAPGQPFGQLPRDGKALSARRQKLEQIVAIWQ